MAFDVWGLWGWKAWRWNVIGFLALASLGWNLYQSQHDLTHDFYSPLTRFWELLLGALLAYGAFTKRATDPNVNVMWGRTANLRATIGVALLLCAVVLIDGSRQFPGVWALLTVVGAVLFISAGEYAWVNRAVFRCQAWCGLAPSATLCIYGIGPSFRLRESLLVKRPLCGFGQYCWWYRSCLLG